MANRSEPTDPRDVEQLRAFGDALAEGRPRSASNDIEETMLRAQRALGANRQVSSAMPDSMKQSIWEDLMHAQPALPTANGETRRAAVPSSRGIISARSQTGSSQRSYDSRFVRAVARWQPAVSLAIVVAFLVGLVGIAYQRNVLVDQNEPDSSGHASQVMYDPDDPSTFPHLPEECISNGAVTPDEELATRDLADWLEPRYAPVQAVTHEQGLAVQESFMRFLRCEMEAFSTATPDGGAWTIPPVVATPELLTYFSDRMRFDRLYPDLTPSQQGDLDTYRCLPRINEILNTFPMPVNEPVDIAMPPVTADVGLEYTSAIFAPSDVYLLPDGRYGAIVGSMSTAALADPNAVTDDDFSRFFAFVEVDGRYYIDELFTIMAPDLDWSTRFGRNGSISTECD